jgi:hypothetical protein
LIPRQNIQGKVSQKEEDTDEDSQKEARGTALDVIALTEVC